MKTTFLPIAALLFVAVLTAGCKRDVTPLVVVRPAVPPKVVALKSKLQPQEVSLGRVAQAASTTKIYAKPSSTSQVFYSVEPKGYVVVRDYNSKWKEVLLKNMRYGYASPKSLTILDYEYKVPASKVNATKGAGSAALSLVGERMTDAGLLESVYGRANKQLLQAPARLVNVGTPIKKLEDLRDGDRLFFWNYEKNAVGHVGIYVPNGYFVHSNKGRVERHYLGDKKWLNHLVAARR